MLVQDYGTLPDVCRKKVYTTALAEVTAFISILLK